MEKRWQLPNGFWITRTLEWFNALMADEVDGVAYTAEGLVYETQAALTLPSIGIELGY